MILYELNGEESTGGCLYTHQSTSMTGSIVTGLSVTTNNDVKCTMSAKLTSECTAG